VHREDVVEDPYVLLRRLKLGREEYCQRLLTMLILEAAYPRWNTRSTPAPHGIAFLRRLHERSFGEPDIPEDAEFVDELDLPARSAAERGGAPDHAVISPECLWMIELKSEVGSHRPAQVPAYFELAHHHYPDRRVDLTYLTPPMDAEEPRTPDGSRYAHLTWDEVAPIVAECWADGTGDVAAVREALIDTLSAMGPAWGTWRERVLVDTVGLAVRQARLTASDGRQRALDHRAQSLEELQRLRLAVRNELRAIMDCAGTTVESWLWNAATSEGVALSEAGRELGYELRFSRSRARGVSA
jgi:hypothetical protein